MDLAAVHAALVPEIQERLAQVAEKPPVAALADTYEELSALFEALALCHLLEFVDLAALAENLCRSGHARRDFLQHSQREGNDNDDRLAPSRTRALFDALSAGDLGLARDLAALSITQWQPDWEYEDDFCFFHFLHRLILGLDGDAKLTSPAMVAVLDRFEALAGPGAPRLAVCRALLRRNQAAFADALARRLDEISRELDVERATSAVQEGVDVGFWPRSFVSTEGLALLKVGELLGLKAPDELPMCPQIARLPTRAHGHDDLFAELARLP